MVWTNTKESQAKRISEAHGSQTYLREPEKDVSIHTFSPSADTPEDYIELQTILDGKQPYDPVFVNDMAPSDRHKCRNWLSNIDCNVQA